MPTRKPISDAAVRTATGKTLEAWLHILDKAGAKKMRHPEIARLLSKKYKVPGWWCQMVTVEYERARGRRKLHETTMGFQVSATKTVAVPLARLYAQWDEPSLRRRWLPGSGEMVIRTATKNKSMRITWVDGATHVEVSFLPKGKNRSQVSVQHKKIATQTAAKKHQIFWRKTLTALAGRLS
ncbi:MAG: hypothetical protein HY340_04005 [Candidatus Kerfeldbacteria bacterium]|nr:hypothetical protein [Candidatus Kerfeldbacteria bacterium]